MVRDIEDCLRGAANGAFVEVDLQTFCSRNKLSTDFRIHGNYGCGRANHQRASHGRPSKISSVLLFRRHFPLLSI